MSTDTIKDKESLRKEGHLQIQELASGYFGLNLPVEDIAEFMHEAEEEDWEFWGNEYECNSVSDTMPREMINHIFAKYYLKMDWPCYGDSVEYSDLFFEKFSELTTARGWRKL